MLKRTVLILAIFLSESVQATVYYRFRGEDGVNVVSAQLTPRAIEVGYEVLSESGKVLRLVPPGNAADATDPRPAATDPDQPPADDYALARRFLDEGRSLEAREALRRTIAADPGHAEAHYYMGLVLLEQGEAEGAKAHLQRYLELAPSGPNAIAAGDLLSALQAALR